jgi:hypothetical protein
VTEAIGVNHGCTARVDEFVQGSGLIGHVPVAQAMGRHIQQVQNLLAGSRNPNVEVPMQNADVQVRVLRDYFPMSAAQRPNAEGVARAQQVPALQLAVEAQPALDQPALEEPVHHVPVQENVNPSSEAVRRSSRSWAMCDGRWAIVSAYRVAGAQGRHSHRSQPLSRSQRARTNFP